MKNTSDGYKAYVISQPYHKEGETTWCCTSNINNETNEYEYKFKASYGEELDINNGDIQFLFIPIENTSSERKLFYIYNVYQKKYIKSDCTLSDDPQDTFSFRDTGKYENTYMLQSVDVETNTNKIINIDNGHYDNGSPNPKMYINSYDTKDGGNSCEIRDIDITYVLISFYTCLSSGPYDDDGITLLDTVKFFKTICIEKGSTISKENLISLLKLNDDGGQYNFWNTHDETEEINENKVYYLYYMK